MSFVLDNSVTMRRFFGDGSVRDMDYATAVLNAMESATVLVPGIWALEVAYVLARSEAKGLVSEARSEAFVGMLRRMDIAVDPETNSRGLSNTLHLARHHKLSSYDAAYLELALRTALPIATLDEELRPPSAQAWSASPADTMRSVPGGLWIESAFENPTAQRTPQRAARATHACPSRHRLDRRTWRALRGAHFVASPSHPLHAR